MSAIRDGQLVGTESVEEHLRNAQMIIWAIRDGFVNAGLAIPAGTWLVDDLNAADARIEAALREYAKEKGTP